MMESIRMDEGFYYGIGLFETMAIEEGQPVFVERHMKRLLKGMRQLDMDEAEIKMKMKIVDEILCENKELQKYKHGMLKIMVSPLNVITVTGENPYQKADYERGFCLMTSPVQRNETSIFTCLKSFNYGDNILEKRRAKSLGFDEPVFLNSKGELTEGAVTNIFFCQGEKIYTPAAKCGLLQGTIREWIMEACPVTETVIRLEDVFCFDEIFVTNSLLGIMPVVQFEQQKFVPGRIAKKMQNRYEIIRTK